MLHKTRTQSSQRALLECFSLHWTLGGAVAKWLGPPELKSGNGNGNEDGHGNGSNDDLGNGNDNSNANGNSSHNRNSKDNDRMTKMVIAKAMALAIEMGMTVTSAMVRTSYQCNGKTYGNWEGNNHDDENCTCNGRSIGDADGNSNGNDDGNGKTVIIQKRTLFGCAQISFWIGT